MLWQQLWEVVAAAHQVEETAFWAPSPSSPYCPNISSWHSGAPSQDASSSSANAAGVQGLGL